MTCERYVFHLAIPENWRAAVAGGGSYAVSTRGLTLESQGYIHCSFRHQVGPTAGRFYSDVPGVLVLTVDIAALDVPLRVESLDGRAEAFPHVYGPIPLHAVAEVCELSAWTGRHPRSEAIPKAAAAAPTSAAAATTMPTSEPC